jgi:hypothetical protein
MFWLKAKRSYPLHYLMDQHEYMEMVWGGQIDQAYKSIRLNVKALMTLENSQAYRSKQRWHYQNFKFH